MRNPYLPVPVRIEKILVETEDRNVKTFTLAFVREEDRERFQYRPGQFAELSVFGKGEAPFGMASSPTRTDGIEFSISRAGLVTNAIHQMTEGDILGVRGPLGNGYPLELFEGKDLVLIGGGFGFSTLRALTNYMIDRSNRGRFGRIAIIYGARRPGFLLYRSDLAKWRERGDIHLAVTVDEAENGWEGKVGFVPAITKEEAPSPENSYAVVCGPPGMIRFTLPVLEELGFDKGQIFLSLEMRMKCGIGKCGRCNIGGKYICKDGPVISYGELLGLTTDDVI
ncbi:MAG: FAD/NAD(P)-binding protein [Deltaproteobacteria bacterium]|nr:FAD/NAD(P)-binding protein [Deltaproteobacteria bacterium]